MISIKPRKASEIAKIVSGKLNGQDLIIDKISIDSREHSSAGACFIGTKGKKYDGNDFINEARQNGASVVITDKENAKAPCIVVENTTSALISLARACKGSTKIIGITGSVGKTTVKNMVISVLSQKYSVVGTKENQNNEIGVALTLLGIKNEDFCVVEMGMRALGEIDLLASFATPELVVITNAKTSHIERLGSEENILNAKLEILNYKPKYAILPNDERFIRRNYGEIKTIFIDEEVEKSRFLYFENGMEFLIYDESTAHKMKIYSFCLHNIQNAEIAFFVGKIYGLTYDQISCGLARFKQDKMREEYLDINGITVINDCYNSSLESLKSSLVSLTTFANIRGKKSNALIGDILELGEYGEKIHTEIGHLCKELKIEKLFLYGELSKYIKIGAGYGEIFENKEDLIKELCEKLNKDDVLLVKASRKLKFENIIEGMKKINE